MQHLYDIDDLTGTPSKRDLAIVRKHSMSYAFVYDRPEVEVCGDFTPDSTATVRQDRITQRKREARLRPHATSDLSLDNGLRERRSLLNGITRTHTCQGKASCKCGKLAAKPPKGLGMKHFMRDVVRQGKAKFHRVNRVLNSHNRAGALLAACSDTASLKACAPILRNHVRVVKAKDRNLL